MSWSTDCCASVRRALLRRLSLFIAIRLTIRMPDSDIMTPVAEFDVTSLTSLDVRSEEDAESEADDAVSAAAVRAHAECPRRDVQPTVQGLWQWHCVTSKRSFAVTKTAAIAHNTILGSRCCRVYKTV